MCTHVSWWGAEGVPLGLAGAQQAEWQAAELVVLQRYDLWGSGAQLSQGDSTR